MSDADGDGNGMFEPLSDAERRKAKRAGSSRKKAAPQPIVPVPADAPTLDWSRLRPNKAEGALVRRWPYFTEDGAIAFHVARWMHKDPQKRKVVRPVTWCRLPNGRKRWLLRAMPAPRPLYDLPDILESTSRLVVVVEGEKCADAAARVFPDCAVTTWAGGTKAWAKTDWQQLAAREVLLVADADRPGRAAMRKLAAHLVAMGCAVRLFLPPGNDSHDIADAVDQRGPEGMAARIKARAIPWKPKAKGPPEDDEGADTTDARRAPATLDPSDAAEATDAGEPAGEANPGEDSGTEDSVDKTDWIEELVDQAREDAGAPFEPDVLEKICKLQRDHKAQWERLRGSLRETKVRIGELDKALKKKGEEQDDSTLRGQILSWPEDEPWFEEVDGADLLDEIANLIMLHVHTTQAKADTMAIWSVYSWMHVEWDISTFLGITSATKRCGKSLTLEVLEELVLRPLNVSGRTTSAAMFRTIEEYRPACILDEADTYLREDYDLRALINGSQRLSGARVLRMVKLGDDWVTASFCTFCPKVIAGIGHLPGTIRDRSIVIELERRAPSATKMPYWGDRDKAQSNALRQKIVRWTEDNAASVYRPRQDVAFPPILNDRARDAWASLLSIAERAGGEWAGESGRAWRACETIAVATLDETDPAEKLLADMWQVFHEALDCEHLPTGKTDDTYDESFPAILPALIAMEGRPWSDYSRNRPLSPRGLANLLRRFKITPSTIRVGEKLTLKGYKRESFVRVWKNYGIGDPEDDPDPIG